MLESQTTPMTIDPEVAEAMLVHLLKKGESPETLANGCRIPVETIYEVMVKHGLAYWCDEHQRYENPETELPV